MINPIRAACAVLVALGPLLVTATTSAKYLPHSDAVHAEAERQQSGMTPLTTWRHVYTYRGQQYKWIMVGTNPAAGSATTTVPTYIIPLVFTFPDGTVLDPRKPGQKYAATPLQVTVASPVFQPYWFVNGSVNLGTTQYIDAFQRGNFWSLVSTVAPKYHVLLRLPKMLPAITIPMSDSSGVFKGPHGVTAAQVDLNMVDKTVRNYMKATTKIAINGFPIFLTYNVSMTDPTGGACGYHSNVGKQTYTVTMFDDNQLCGHVDGDVDTLTHEVAEWVDDPYGNNVTPDRFGILEVGDPATTFGFYAPTNAFTYTLQDLMFHDWFTCTKPSSSVNGLYDYMGEYRGPDCGK